MCIGNSSEKKLIALQNSPADTQPDNYIFKSITHFTYGLGVVKCSRKHRKCNIVTTFIVLQSQNVLNNRDLIHVFRRVVNKLL